MVKAIADYAGYAYTAPNQTPSSENTYIVQRGDTLYSIARKFNTTVDNLKELNNLTSNTITPGMELYINKPAQTTTYIVQIGDTLYSIAREFNTTVQELQQLNNLVTTTLSIGQELFIPQNNTSLPPNDNYEPELPPLDELPPTTEEYIVKRGDSLWLIAKNFNTTVDNLINLNNLDTINLQVGDILLVPSINNSNKKTYIVQKGDTLWSIARDNNITVQELKEQNYLTSNLLSVGQELII